MSTSEQSTSEQSSSEQSSSEQSVNEQSSSEQSFSEHESGTVTLTTAFDDGVATITLTRPERLNAFSTEMQAALAEALEVAEADSDVRAVVLTGAGRGFCAGGDVQGQRQRAQERRADGQGSAEHNAVESNTDRLRLSHRATSLKLHQMAKPTIAAVNGPAAGAGLSLALACDIRLMARNAVMTTAFARVGFSGDFGGSWFLTKLVGTAMAKELYFTSARIDSDRALDLGLANHVFDDANFRADAADFAAGLAHGPTLAFRYMKENLNRALVSDLATCLDAEAAAMTRTGQSADHREGATAFTEKRPPHFEGR